MNPSVAVAFMTKMKLIFETDAAGKPQDDSFLAFQNGAFAVGKDSFYFMEPARHGLGPNETAQAMMSFDKTFNFVATVDDIITSAPDELDQVYYETLRNCPPASSTRTADQEARYQAALAYLHSPWPATMAPSLSALDNYQRYSDAYKAATSTYKNGQIAADSATGDGAAALQQAWQTDAPPPAASLRRGPAALENQGPPRPGRVQAPAQSGFGVGAAVTAETPERDGGAMQQFAAATIISHPALGTFEVHGLIRDRYVRDGGIQGNTLGYPFSDEEADPAVPGGRRSRFQFGQLTWSAAVGVTLMGANGRPTPSPQPDPAPTPTPAADAAPPAPLHQLTDVTERVLRELSLVPGGSKRPGAAKRAGDAAPFLPAKMGELPADADKSTWQSLLLACEANDVTLLDTWDPQPLAAIAGLVAQDTADPQVFTLADGAFDFDGRAEVLHVVLERPGNVFPKLVAVSFPKSLLESEETPFLIYFHPTLGQTLSSGYYTAAPNLKSPEDGNFYPAITRTVRPFLVMLLFMAARGLRGGKPRRGGRWRDTLPGRGSLPPLGYRTGFIPSTLPLRGSSTKVLLLVCQ